jgi:hypothetical protein
MKPPNGHPHLPVWISFGSRGQTPPRDNWLWYGYFAGGELTLLTSLWKSGKTTLLSVLLSRMKDSGELLGMQVRPTRALVLSEESQSLWHMRHQRLALGDNVQVMCQPFAGKKPTDAEWRAMLERCGDVLGPNGRRLLVVDTVTTLMPAGVETNADCMVRALAPLRCLADQGLAIGILHHPHKGKVRAGKWSRGTGSLPSSVDIALEMHPYAADDISDRRRVLLGMSRHEETPRRLVFEWNADAHDYRVLPDTLDPEFDRGWSAIRRVLVDFEDPQPAAMILRNWPADSPPPSRATLHRWLARAVEHQWLACETSERRNAPYQYWLADEERVG